MKWGRVEASEADLGDEPRLADSPLHFFALRPRIGINSVAKRAFGDSNDRIADP
jgi:hypothetical protein